MKSSANFKCHYNDLGKYILNTFITKRYITGVFQGYKGTETNRNENVTCDSNIYFP